MKKKLSLSLLAVLVLVASCTATPPPRRKLQGASRPPANYDGGGALFRWPPFSRPARPGQRTRPSPPRVSQTLRRAGRRPPAPRARSSKRESFKLERERARQTKEYWRAREVW